MQKILRLKMQQGPIDYKTFLNMVEEASMNDGVEGVIALIDRNSANEVQMNIFEKLQFANAVFIWAVRNGFENLTEKLIADPRVDPAVNKNCAFDIAVQKRNAVIVRQLLAHPRVNPADFENHAIKSAASMGCAQLVKILLADDRVNPTVGFYAPLRIAVNQGHTQVVELLLADSRIDSSFAFNRYSGFPALPKSKEHNYKIAKLLLTDINIEHDIWSDVLRIATTIANNEVVKLVLRDPRVGPTVKVSDALFASVKFGNVEVLRLLLENPRVDPSADDHYAIREAIRMCHLEAIDVLLDHPAVMAYVSENIAQFKDNKSVYDIIFKKFLAKMSPCIAALHANNMPNEVIVNNFGLLIHPLFQHYAKCVNDKTKTSPLSYDSLSLIQSSNMLLPIYENNKMDVIDSKERNPAKKIKVEENIVNQALEQPSRKKRRTGMFGHVELF